MRKFGVYVVLLILVFFSCDVNAQYSKDGYLFHQKIDAPRVRRPVAHEIMVDPLERLLVVSYSSYPTVVVLYEFDSWKVVGTYNIPEWFDLGHSYVDMNGRYIYLDFARYSSKYRRIDVETQKVDTVECYQTPRGCVPKEGGIEQKEYTTKDKKYYITINKKNKRDILIFRKHDE